MRYPMLITAEWLRGEGACKRAVARFKRHWPKGARVTANNWVLADKRGFYIGWLIYHMPERKQRQYRIASNRHDKAWGRAYDKLVSQQDKGLFTEKELSKKVDELNRDEKLKNGHAFVRLWRSCRKK